MPSPEKFKKTLHEAPISKEIVDEINFGYTD